MIIIMQVLGIGGYRDVILNVVLDDGGVKIIGEIQVQYEKLYDLKQQVCLSVHDQNDSSFSSALCVCVWSKNTHIFVVE